MPILTRTARDSGRYLCIYLRGGFWGAWAGGFGVVWQPNARILVGVRALVNNDEERRTDLAGAREGLARSQECRAGISVSPWAGALLDHRLALRFGLDETSPTAGFSWKLAPFDIGFAYVDNMAHARVGDLFGTHSRSFLLTVGLDYRALLHKP